MTIVKQWTSWSRTTDTEIAPRMGVPKCAVSQLKKAAKGGRALRKHSGGRRRAIISQEHSYISPSVEIEQTYYFWTDSCRPCQRYWCWCVYKNNFLGTEKCYLYVWKLVTYIPYKYIIVGKDYFGVRSIFVMINNSRESCFLMNPTSLPTLIPDISLCRERKTRTITRMPRKLMAMA